MKLSPKCRKAALQDPCSKDASAAAAEKCARHRGTRGYGACITAVYEAQLVEKCGKIVCPNDPMMVEDQGTASVVTTQQRAGEGGLYSAPEDAIAMQAAWEEGEVTEGGVDPSKMRLYLGLGIGVVVLLIMAKRN